jgi:hypothetical protein
MAVVPRLVDVTRGDVVLTLGSFYDDGWSETSRCPRRGTAGVCAVEPATLPAPVRNKYPEALTLKLDALPKDEGDYDIVVELRSAARVHARGRAAVARGAA